MRGGGGRRPATKARRPGSLPWWGIRTLALVTASLSLALLAVVPALAEQPAARPPIEPGAGTVAARSETAAPRPASTSIAEPTSAAGASWTLAQAEAAVRAAAIARLPGAPAVVDEDTIRAAVGDAPIRVVLVPFAPVDNTRAAMEQQPTQLQAWAQSQGWGLIVVQGLQVLVGGYDVRPATIADLQPVLAADEVTHQVLRAITVLHQQSVTTSGTAPTTAGAPSTGGVALPGENAADPGQVQQIGDALAAGRVYSDPALPTKQAVTSDWANVGPGLTMRAAFLPAVAPGQPLTDLITPLSSRFPDDVVAVVRGRWIEVAGPDQEILDSALLWLYGNYMKPFLRWDLQPADFVGLLAGQIGLLRTGVVSDQSPSSAPAGASASSGAWLWWAFVAAALLLAGGVGWWVGRSRRNTRMAAEAADRATILVRRRFGARMAAVAGRIAVLDQASRDGLAGGEAAHDRSAPQQAARDEVVAAVQRYREARTVLTGGGDMEVADRTLDLAERHLVAAGRALGGSAP